MALVLSRYSANDSIYVTKLNNDMLAIETAVNGLTAAVGGGGGSGGGTAGLNDVWDRDGIVGASAFIATAISNTHLSFTSGSVWRLDQQIRGRPTAAQQFNFIGKASGTYQIVADTAGNLSVSTASAALTIYRIAWNNPGFGSAERLVPILLHGDDYARMLSSVAYGSFVRVADRLSTIDGAIAIDAMYAQKILSGLTWDFRAGQVRTNNVVVSAASGTITLSTTAQHSIEVDPTTGVVSYSSAGFTSGAIPLRYIRTSGGTIVSNDDVRTWAIAAGSGAGTALVISGTPETDWTLNIDLATGSPVSDANVRVARGSSLPVALRWDEVLDQWEFTNDGSTFIAMIGAQNLNIGGGRSHRLNMVISAPTVLLQANRSSTSAPPYEALSLSTYVSTTAFAALLRGSLVDSNPAVSGVAPGVAFYRDSSTIVGAGAAKIFAVPASQPQPQMLVVPLSNQQCVFEVVTSSNFTATLTVNLIGFFDTVQGVGTQRISGTQTSLALSGGIGSNTNLSSPFAAIMNRGTVYYLETSGSMGAGSLYDVEFYSTSAFAASQLLFQAINIDASAAYATRLPWVYEDLDSSVLVHLRFSNNGTTSGLFSVKMVAERFA